MCRLWTPHSSARSFYPPVAGRLSPLNCYLLPQSFNVSSGEVGYYVNARDGRQNEERPTSDLELARIGSLLFVFADSWNDQIGFSSIIGTFATRLSAQPLNKPNKKKTLLVLDNCE